MRFLDRSFQRSVEDARSEPTLLRSTLRQSALLEGIALVLLLWHGRRHPAPNRFRQAKHLSIALLLQQGFVALHLGMTQPRHGAPRCPTLGPANFLTLLRGLCAMLLLTSSIADLPLYLLLCAVGSGTDSLDGAVARRYRRPTRMGQMLDPAMDVCFYSVAIKIGAHRGGLPRWFGWVVVTRFLLPIGAGLYRYFRWARPMEAAHTIWGKLAGALLMIMIPLGVYRPRTAHALCLPTSAVLLLAAVVQCRRALRPSEAGAQAGYRCDNPASGFQSGTLAR